ncbi:hypothetical protein Pmani_030325 [Petrolisthes manimaculis]|uniref:Uncharacterized protein n=1 Tax=Petrolisthes manimaculis TaxID=1843537 RepID=A0AAE1NXJ4_9EUCA|nr:hypothetical protein Pmani_030325 [Petrolisthes manimaculis]
MVTRQAGSEGKPHLTTFTQTHVQYFQTLNLSSPSTTTTTTPTTPVCLYHLSSPSPPPPPPLPPCLPIPSLFSLTTTTPACLSAYTISLLPHHHHPCLPVCLYHLSSPSPPPPPPLPACLPIPSLFSLTTTTTPASLSAYTISLLPHHHHPCLPVCLYHLSSPSPPPPPPLPACLPIPSLFSLTTTTTPASLSAYTISLLPHHHHPCLPIPSLFSLTTTTTPACLPIPSLFSLTTTTTTTPASLSAYNISTLPSNIFPNRFLPTITDQSFITLTLHLVRTFSFYPNGLPLCPHRSYLSLPNQPNKSSLPLNLTLSGTIISWFYSELPSLLPDSSFLLILSFIHMYSGFPFLVPVFILFWP